MSESILREEIPVYSKKHDVHGVVKDYGIVTKLFFTYDEREIEMGIDRNPLKNESFEDIGRRLIESYIEDLSVSGRKLQLHYWYIGEHEIHGEVYRIGHGIVTGHRKIADSVDLHSSAVQAVSINEEAGKLIMTTKNSVYHCPLSYCRFEKQDEYPDIIPDYERIKEKYENTIEYPSIEQGKVLLVLADFCNYFFHSLYYVPKGSPDGKKLEFSGGAHIGTFQDSYLIRTEDCKIDLRYFPHFQNIEFYSECTDGCPLYLENIGEVVIYASTSCGKIKLEPGQRKEVTRSNAEKETPVLPGGDLYPAGIIE